MDANSIQIQALVTFMMPFFIQLAKRSKARVLGWIDQAKPGVSVAASAATALATSMGMQFAHTPHSLTVTWPDATTLAHGFLTFAAGAVLQFAGQHALYEGLWRQVVPAKRNPSSLVSSQ
jgi:hypothetical protein